MHNIPSTSHNPFTGHLAAGYRFRFKIRAITHKSINLPLDMKNLPQIKSLLGGVSPLEVFKVKSICEARKAFVELRKQFDFPFWAATEYYVRDIDDPDRVVTLKLNRFQHQVADTFLRRYYDGEEGRYVITKSCGRVGLTTCVQAYIIWRQTFNFYKDSFTCSHADTGIDPLKANICRYLHRNFSSIHDFITIPKINKSAYFHVYSHANHFNTRHLGYVHFADMSRWRDGFGDYSSDLYSDTAMRVPYNYYTLVVLEGNIPLPERFEIKKHQILSIDRFARFVNLAKITHNPFFLDHVALANIPNVTPHLHPINLSPIK